MKSTERKPAEEKKILSSDRADWMLWFLARSPNLPRTTVVRLACACARTALRYVPAGEHRPLKAIEAAEKWAENPTRINLKIAKAAARDAAKAARAAAREARAAARAVANAAACTSRAAAWAAYAAAWAGNAAANAAYAPAYAANAADAAANAAYTAAWTSGAVYDAAQKKMAGIIKEEFRRRFGGKEMR